MEANRHDAEDCVRAAKRAASEENYEKAIRFLEKSIKMYPLDVAKTRQRFKNIDYIFCKDLLEIYKEKLENNDKENSPNTETHSKSSYNSANENNKHSNQNSASHTDFSQDQWDAVKKIKSCRDFYEILGVPKSASDADLKKAYRKLALQFHPDKNKAPGATEAFKMIGKAFSILSDTSKRQQYDQLGPDSFEETSQVRSSARNRHNHSNHARGYHNTQFYWNDDDFSADELFNLFFGVNPGGNRTQRAHHYTFTDRQSSTNVGNHAVLFQLLPLLLIVGLTLLSNLLSSDPLYSLHKTEKYSTKRTTADHHVPYFVKPDFRLNSQSDYARLERQVEEDLLAELRQTCFRERSYKEAAIWRARNYGDERLIKKAYEYETPSCTRLKEIFGIA